MANSFIPSQIANIPYVPPEVAPDNVSQVVIGRDLTVTFEAVGNGQNGRPDPVQIVTINLTYNGLLNGTVAKNATISFNADDIFAIQQNNSNAPNPITLTLTEIDVCQNGTPMKAVCLLSQVYAPSS